MADMEWKEFTAKTVDEAVKKASEELGVSENDIDYEVIEKGKTNLLSILSKPAVIKAGVKKKNSDENQDSENLNSEESIEKSGTEDDAAEKSEVQESIEFFEADLSNFRVNEDTDIDSGAEDSEAGDSDVSEKKDSEELVILTNDERDKAENKACEFLDNIFNVMDLDVVSTYSFKGDDNVLSIDLEGDEMGILIGKRGSTLDSLQYLVNLVVNKDSETYIKVKIDTENYRERRKATLENLAKNLALKVRRTGKPVFLEPMNPYERRIIHFALQNDEFCETHSEGEEPHRKVVITLKPGVKPEYRKRGRYDRGGRSYGKGRRDGDYRRRRSGYNRDKYRDRSYGDENSSNEGNSEIHDNTRD